MAKAEGQLKTLVITLTLIGLVESSIVSAYAQESSKKTRQSFFILGAVRKPGVYQLDGQVSLLKLIVTAGGLADKHGSNAYIIRERFSRRADSDAADSETQPKYDVIKVSIHLLLNNGIDADVYLQRGDIVNIPIAGLFWFPDDRPGFIKPSPRYWNTPPIRKRAPCQKGEPCLALVISQPTNPDDLPGAR
jgi:hypothetical protein